MRHTRAAIVAAVLFAAAFIAPRETFAAPFSVTNTDNGQALLAALFGANPIGLSDFTIQHRRPARVVGHVHRRSVRPRPRSRVEHRPRRAISWGRTTATRNGMPICPPTSVSSAPTATTCRLTITFTSAANVTALSFNWVFASEEFGGTPVTRDLVARQIRVHARRRGLGQSRRSIAHRAPHAGVPDGAVHGRPDRQRRRRGHGHAARCLVADAAVDGAARRRDAYACVCACATTGMARSTRRCSSRPEPSRRSARSRSRRAWCCSGTGLVEPE